MDSGERAKYKQLANDSIIATFGYETREQKLAEALERCVREIERLNVRPHCATCNCEYDVREQV